MFNFVSENSTSYSVQLVEDNFRFELRGFFNLSKNRQFRADLANFEFKLRRNLADDTYNLWLTHQRNESPYWYATQFNINNKVSGHSANRGQYPLLASEDFVHHSLFGSMAFGQTSLISCDWFAATHGFALPDKISFEANPLANLTISIEPLSTPTNLDLKTQEIGVIKSLKELSIKFLPDTFPGGDTFVTGVNSERHFQVTKSYNYVLVKPRPIDQFAFAREVCDLYIANESGANAAYDFLIDNVNYKSSAVAGEIAATHFYNNNKQLVSFDLITNGSRQTQIFEKIGAVKIGESMYYDYDQKSTVKGVATNSQIGELVPYRFEGGFLRQFDLIINRALKKIKVRYYENIAQPVLHAFRGRVKLLVSAAPRIKTLKYRFSLAKIKTIKEKVAAKNSLPLIGLTELSDASKP